MEHEKTDREDGLMEYILRERVGRKDLTSIQYLYCASELAIGSGNMGTYSAVR